jgi:hypothetical protein
MRARDCHHREAQKLEGSKVERRQQLVEVVTGVVVELIQTLSPTLVCDSKGKEKGMPHAAPHVTSCVLIAAILATRRKQHRGQRCSCGGFSAGVRG